MSEIIGRLVICFFQGAGIALVGIVIGYALGYCFSAGYHDAKKERDK